jgi:aryl-alcohol dehydrogenase-like predicted oxidoreductase
MSAKPSAAAAGTIPGSGSPEHVAENVAAASVELTGSEEQAKSAAVRAAGSPRVLSRCDAGQLDP